MFRKALHQCSPFTFTSLGLPSLSSPGRQEVLWADSRLGGQEQVRRPGSHALGKAGLTPLCVPHCIAMFNVWVEMREIVYALTRVRPTFTRGRIHYSLVHLVVS